MESLTTETAEKASPVKETTDLGIVLQEERKRHREQIEHFIKDFRRIERLLRKPLTIALGFAASILNVYEEEDKLSVEEFKKLMEQLETVESSVCSLETTLVNIILAEMITHDRIKLEKKTFDIYSVAKGALESFYSRVYLKRKKIVVDYSQSMKPGDGLISADLHLCTILLRNLFDNAIKYAEGGRICFGAYNRGNVIQFNVYNQGNAIPNEEIGKMFDKGFSSEEDAFGLGLFVARGIVEAHGGRIWFETNRTEGVNALFQLPKE